MMKKIGMPAMARGAVKSITLCPASMLALETEKTMYVSFETWTFSCASLGSFAMAGVKIVRAHDW